MFYNYYYKGNKWNIRIDSNKIYLFFKYVYYVIYIVVCIKWLNNFFILFLLEGYFDEC